jgi:hypothetical protein
MELNLQRNTAQPFVVFIDTSNNEKKKESIVIVGEKGKEE